MAARADHHDPSAAVGGQRWMQPDRQREVAEMIRGELQFPAVRRVLLRRVHDARVVDQHVQRAVAPPGDEGVDGGEVGQVELSHLDGAALSREPGSHPLAGFDVANRQGDIGSHRSECACSLQSDA